MNAGLLILRVVVGGLMVGHGTQKLFGWFKGPGPRGATGFVSSLGYKPAYPLAVMLGLTEATAGLMLMAGFAIPVAAAMIGAVMLNAIVSVHWSKGMWNQEGGYEFPLTLWTVAVALAFVGSGAYGMDHAIGWTMSGVIAGFYAFAGGVMLGGVGLALRTRPQSAAAERIQQQHRAA